MKFAIETRNCAKAHALGWAALICASALLFAAATVGSAQEQPATTSPAAAAPAATSNAQPAPDQKAAPAAAPAKTDSAPAEHIPGKEHLKLKEKQDKDEITATHNQGQWKVENVDQSPGADVGRFASLVIDRAGNFHVAYYDKTNKALRYGFRPRNDKRWFIMAVEGKGSGTYVSMAVDSQGHPHLAYNSPKEDGLHYAYFDGRSWKITMLDTTRINYYTSIQLDKDGNPRISYYLYHAPDGTYLLHLKYAEYDGKAWTIQTLDRRPETGKFNSLAVDQAGLPSIAYTNVSTGDLLFAKYDGKDWKFSDADSRRFHNSYVGIGNSIAVDAAGNAHIAYFDGTRNTVKYAHWTGEHWETQVVDQLVSRGEADRVSLKIDKDGHPHIAYYDAGTGSLKYAAKTDKLWNVQTVDNEGNVGMYPSLSFDPAGVPYIAYYAVDSGSLRLAHLVGPAPAPAVAEKQQQQK